MTPASFGVGAVVDGERIHGAPAMFGPELVPGEAVCGRLQVAQPFDACSPLVGDQYHNAIVLVRRSRCYFEEKVVHAQRAGARAAIVLNSAEAGAPHTMAASPSTDESHVAAIPAIMVGSAQSRALRAARGDVCVQSFDRAAPAESVFVPHAFLPATHVPLEQQTPAFVVLRASNVVSRDSEPLAPAMSAMLQQRLAQQLNMVLEPIELVD